MNKKRAIELLGGSPKLAAAAIGISSSAVSQWPDELPRSVEDRVVAALARKHLPPHLLGAEAAPQAVDSLPSATAQD